MKIDWTIPEDTPEFRVAKADLDWKANVLFNGYLQWLALQAFATDECRRGRGYLRGLMKGNNKEDV